MTTDSSTYDVIVVGGGPGGLSAAASLAATGQRVIVVDQHSVVGGNCTVFRRKDLEFDVGLHYVGECGPGGLVPSLLEGLGVGDRVAYRELDPDAFDTLHFPDFTFRVPASWAKYRERLVAQFPAERAGIEGYLDLLEALGTQARGAGRSEGFGNLLVEWGLRPLDELFAHFELGQRAVAVLDYWSGLYGSGPATTATAVHALIVDHYLRGGAYTLANGGQTLPAALVDVIESLGGEIRTLTRVERILVEDGAVRGVRLHTGETLYAPIVVSNADYKRTMLDLVEPAHLSPEAVRWASEATMTLPLVSSYVVVEGDLEQPPTNGNLFVFDHYDLEAEYRMLEDGGVGDGLPFIFISPATHKDPGHPGLCPPGHTNFQVMTMAPAGYGPWGVETGPANGARYRRVHAYREIKTWYEGRMLDVAERVLGPFRHRIVHVETATPLTQERYTWSTQGTSYGLRHSPDQTGPFRPQHRTEIAGLFLAGANTTTGHGIVGTLSGGALCAGEIVDRDLLGEMRAGHQLVDPDLIRPMEADRDPLEVSRGLALRARRNRTKAAVA